MGALGCPVPMIAAHPEKKPLAMHAQLGAHFIKARCSVHDLYQVVFFAPFAQQ
jgi:hypothetical protein